MAESSYNNQDAPAGGNQQERQRSEALNEKLGTIVKFASTSFTRAKQYTIEKLGRAESVTQFDTEFEQLCEKVQQIKVTTERILSTLEPMIQPNPNIRFEEIVYSKLDRIQPHHSSPHELLGVELTRAGNEFGPETQYGGYLVRCGQVENKIGGSERRFNIAIRSQVITSLKAFLEVDIKNILKEQRVLNLIRLDLDACKSAVKKAPPGEKLQQAESYLRSVQADYDIQLGKLRENMEKIVQTHVNNLGHMKTMMGAIRTYHSECLAHLEEISSDLASSSLVFNSTPVTGSFGGYDINKDEARNARVLYDFESEDDSGLSVNSDQVIVVYPIDDDHDYYIAQADDKFGKIPAGYLELL